MWPIAWHRKHCRTWGAGILWHSSTDIAKDSWKKYPSLINLDASWFGKYAFTVGISWPFGACSLRTVIGLRLAVFIIFFSSNLENSLGTFFNTIQVFLSGTLDPSRLWDLGSSTDESLPSGWGWFFKIFWSFFHSVWVEVWDSNCLSQASFVAPNKPFQECIITESIQKKTWPMLHVEPNLLNPQPLQRGFASLHHRFWSLSPRQRSKFGGNDRFRFDFTRFHKVTDELFR